MLTPIYPGNGKLKIKRPKTERKAIYKALKNCGFNTRLSMRMRDWTYSHIRTQLKLHKKQKQFSREYKKNIQYKPMNQAPNTNTTNNTG